MANECPTQVYVYSLLFDKKGKLMTDGGLKWSDFASTMDQLHCVRTPAASQMCAICVHRGEGVKKGQKTACTLLVCPLGNILAAESDYRMPRVESKCNRRENCLPNMGSLIFYLSGPSNFCLPAISLFDIFIKQDNSCKLLRQESRHNNRNIFESDVWSWLIIPKKHCWSSEHVKKWNAR